MKSVNKDSDEKMSHTHTKIICMIFNSADVTTPSESYRLLYYENHYFHSLRINNFNLSHLSVFRVKNLFADGTLQTF